MADTSKNLGVYFDASANIIHAAHMNAKDMALLTNNSGGDLTTGDVVVLDTSGNSYVTTTTTAGDLRPVFVLGQDITGDNTAAAKTATTGNPWWFYKAGAYVPAANVDGAVTRGDYLKTSGTAKKFTTTSIQAAAGAMPPSTARAIALASIGVAGTIPVLLLPTQAAYYEGCRVYKTATQSINAGATTAITFEFERYDTASLHSTVSNTSRLTAPTAGIYYIWGLALWASIPISGSVNSLNFIQLNGTTQISTSQADGNPYTLFTTDSIYQLSAGDYVELMAHNYTAGAINITNSANYATEFGMQRIG